MYLWTEKDIETDAWTLVLPVGRGPSSDIHCDFAAITAIFQAANATFNRVMARVETMECFEYKIFTAGWLFLLSPARNFHSQPPQHKPSRPDFPAPLSLYRIHKALHPPSI
jgi:hypothetical protein